MSDIEEDDFHEGLFDDEGAMMHDDDDDGDEVDEETSQPALEESHDPATPPQNFIAPIASSASAQFVATGAGAGWSSDDSDPEDQEPIQETRGVQSTSSAPTATQAQRSGTAPTPEAGGGQWVRYEHPGSADRPRLLQEGDDGAQRQTLRVPPSHALANGSDTSGPSSEAYFVTLHELMKSAFPIEEILRCGWPELSEDEKAALVDGSGRNEGLPVLPNLHVRSPTGELISDFYCKLVSALEGTRVMGKETALLRTFLEKAIKAASHVEDESGEGLLAAALTYAPNSSSDAVIRNHLNWLLQLKPSPRSGGLLLLYRLLVNEETRSVAVRSLTLMEREMLFERILQEARTEPLPPLTAQANPDWASITPQLLLQLAVANGPSMKQLLQLVEFLIPNGSAAESLTCDSTTFSLIASFLHSQPWKSATQSAGEMTKFAPNLQKELVSNYSGRTVVPLAGDCLVFQSNKVVRISEGGSVVKEAEGSFFSAECTIAGATVSNTSSDPKIQLFLNTGEVVTFDVEKFKFEDGAPSPDSTRLPPSLFLDLEECKYPPSELPVSSESGKLRRQFPVVELTDSLSGEWAQPVVPPNRIVQWNSLSLQFALLKLENGADGGVFRRCLLAIETPQGHTASVFLSRTVDEPRAPLALELCFTQRSSGNNELLTLELPWNGNGVYHFAANLSLAATRNSASRWTLFRDGKEVTQNATKSDNLPPELASLQHVQQMATSASGCPSYGIHFLPVLERCFGGSRTAPRRLGVGIGAVGVWSTTRPKGQIFFEGVSGPQIRNDGSDSGLLFWLPSDEGSGSILRNVSNAGSPASSFWIAHEALAWCNATAPLVPRPSAPGSDGSRKIPLKGWIGSDLPSNGASARFVVGKEYIFVVPNSLKCVAVFCAVTGAHVTVLPIEEQKVPVTFDQCALVMDETLPVTRLLATFPGGSIILASHTSRTQPELLAEDLKMRRQFFSSEGPVSARSIPAAINLLLAAAIRCQTEFSQQDPQGKADSLMLHATDGATASGLWWSVFDNLELLMTILASKTSTKEAIESPSVECCLLLQLLMWHCSQLGERVPPVVLERTMRLVEGIVAVNARGTLLAARLSADAATLRQQLQLFSLSPAEQFDRLTQCITFSEFSSMLPKQKLQSVLRYGIRRKKLDKQKHFLRILIGWSAAESTDSNGSSCEAQEVLLFVFLELIALETPDPTLEEALLMFLTTVGNVVQSCKLEEGVEVPFPLFSTLYPLLHLAHRIPMSSKHLNELFRIRKAIQAKSSIWRGALSGDRPDTLYPLKKYCLVEPDVLELRMGNALEQLKAECIFPFCASKTLYISVGQESAGLAPAKITVSYSRDSKDTVEVFQLSAASSEVVVAVPTATHKITFASMEAGKRCVTVRVRTEMAANISANESRGSASWSRAAFIVDQVLLFACERTLGRAQSKDLPETTCLRAGLVNQRLLAAGLPSNGVEDMFSKIAPAKAMHKKLSMLFNNEGELVSEWKRVSEAILSETARKNINLTLPLRSETRLTLIRQFCCVVAWHCQPELFDEDPVRSLEEALHSMRPNLALLVERAQDEGWRAMVSARASWLLHSVLPSQRIHAMLANSPETGMMRELSISSPSQKGSTDSLSSFGQFRPNRKTIRRFLQQHDGTTTQRSLVVGDLIRLLLDLSETAESLQQDLILRTEVAAAQVMALHVMVDFVRSNDCTQVHEVYQSALGLMTGMDTHSRAATFPRGPRPPKKQFFALPRGSGFLMEQKLSSKLVDLFSYFHYCPNPTLQTKIGYLALLCHPWEESTLRSLLSSDRWVCDGCGSPNDVETIKCIFCEKATSAARTVSGNRVHSTEAKSALDDILSDLKALLLMPLASSHRSSKLVANGFKSRDPQLSDKLLDLSAARVPNSVQGHYVLPNSIHTQNLQTQPMTDEFGVGVPVEDKNVTLVASKGWKLQPGGIPVYYFEASVTLNTAPDPEMWFGLSATRSNITGEPDPKNGYWYISQNGLYVSPSGSREFCPPFGEGDTIGVGVLLDQRSLFFTKNGRFLGFADRGLPESAEVFPMFGGKFKDASGGFSVHFGPRPFQYDFTQLTATQEQSQGESVLTPEKLSDCAFAVLEYWISLAQGALEDEEDEGEGKETVHQSLAIWQKVVFSVASVVETVFAELEAAADPRHPVCLRVEHQAFGVLEAIIETASCMPENEPRLLLLLLKVIHRLHARLAAEGSATGDESKIPKPIALESVRTLTASLLQLRFFEILSDVELALLENDASSTLQDIHLSCFQKLLSKGNKLFPALLPASSTPTTESAVEYIPVWNSGSTITPMGRIWAVGLQPLPPSGITRFGFKVVRTSRDERGQSLGCCYYVGLLSGAELENSTETAVYRWSRSYVLHDNDDGDVCRTFRLSRGSMPLNSKGRIYGSHDTVWLEYDGDRRTITFFRDEVCLGQDAFTDVDPTANGGLYPFAFLYNEDATVELLPNRPGAALDGNQISGLQAVLRQQLVTTAPVTQSTVQVGAWIRTLQCLMMTPTCGTRLFLWIKDALSSFSSLQRAGGSEGATGLSPTQEVNVQLALTLLGGRSNHARASYQGNEAAISGLCLDDSGLASAIAYLASEHRRPPTVVPLASLVGRFMPFIPKGRGEYRLPNIHSLDQCLASLSDFFFTTSCVPLVLSQLLSEEEENRRAIEVDRAKWLQERTDEFLPRFLNPTALPQSAWDSSYSQQRPDVLFVSPYVAVLSLQSKAQSRTPTPPQVRWIAGTPQNPQTTVDNILEFTVQCQDDDGEPPGERKWFIGFASGSAIAHLQSPALQSQVSWESKGVKGLVTLPFIPKASPKHTNALASIIISAKFDVKNKKLRVVRAIDGEVLVSSQVDWPTGLGDNIHPVVAVQGGTGTVGVVLMVPSTKSQPRILQHVPFDTMSGPGIAFPPRLPFLRSLEPIKSMIRISGTTKCSSCSRQGSIDFSNPECVWFVPIATTQGSSHPALLCHSCFYAWANAKHYYAELSSVMSPDIARGPSPVSLYPPAKLRVNAPVILDEPLPMKWDVAASMNISPGMPKPTETLFMHGTAADSATLLGEVVPPGGSSTFSCSFDHVALQDQGSLVRMLSHTPRFLVPGSLENPAVPAPKAESECFSHIQSFTTPSRAFVVGPVLDPNRQTLLVLSYHAPEGIPRGDITLGLGCVGEPTGSAESALKLESPHFNGFITTCGGRFPHTPTENSTVVFLLFSPATKEIRIAPSMEDLVAGSKTSTGKCSITPYPTEGPRRMAVVSSVQGIQCTVYSGLITASPSSGQHCTIGLLSRHIRDDPTRFRSADTVLFSFEATSSSDVYTVHVNASKRRVTLLRNGSAVKDTPLPESLYHEGYRPAVITSQPGQIVRPSRNPLSGRYSGVVAEVLSDSWCRVALTGFDGPAVLCRVSSLLSVGIPISQYPFGKPLDEEPLFVWRDESNDTFTVGTAHGEFTARSVSMPKIPLLACSTPEELITGAKRTTPATPVAVSPGLVSAIQRPDLSRLASLPPKVAALDSRKDSFTFVVGSKRPSGSVSSHNGIVFSCVAKTDISITALTQLSDRTGSHKVELFTRFGPLSDDCLKGSGVRAKWNQVFGESLSLVDRDYYRIELRTPIKVAKGQIVSLYIHCDNNCGVAFWSHNGRMGESFDANETIEVLSGFKARNDEAFGDITSQVVGFRGSLIYDASVTCVEQYVASPGWDLRPFSQGALPQQLLPLKCVSGGLDATASITEAESPADSSVLTDALQTAEWGNEASFFVSPNFPIALTQIRLHARLRSQSKSTQVPIPNCVEALIFVASGIPKQRRGDASDSTPNSIGLRSDSRWVQRCVGSLTSITGPGVGKETRSLLTMPLAFPLLVEGPTTVVVRIPVDTPIELALASAKLGVAASTNQLTGFSAQVPRPPTPESKLFFRGLLGGFSWINSVSLRDTSGVFKLGKGFNNSQSYCGVMFDIVPLQDMVLEEYFWVPDTSNSVQVQMFWRQGGYQGSERNRSAWTELTRGPRSMTLSDGHETSIGRIDLPLRANERYALYLNVNHSSGVRYYSEYGGSSLEDGRSDSDGFLRVITGRRSEGRSPFDDIASGPRFPQGRLLYHTKATASPIITAPFENVAPPNASTIPSVCPSMTLSLPQGVLGAFALQALAGLFEDEDLAPMLLPQFRLLGFKALHILSSRTSPALGVTLSVSELENQILGLIHRCEQRGAGLSSGVISFRQTSTDSLPAMVPLTGGRLSLGNLFTMEGFPWEEFRKEVSVPMEFVRRKDSSTATDSGEKATPSPLVALGPSQKQIPELLRLTDLVRSWLRTLSQKVLLKVGVTRLLKGPKAGHLSRAEFLHQTAQIPRYLVAQEFSVLAKVLRPDAVWALSEAVLASLSDPTLPTRVAQTCLTYLQAILRSRTIAEKHFLGDGKRRAAFTALLLQWAANFDRGARHLALRLLIEAVADVQQPYLGEALLPSLVTAFETAQALLQGKWKQPKVRKTSELLLALIITVQRVCRRNGMVFLQHLREAGRIGEPGPSPSAPGNPSTEAPTSHATPKSIMVSILEVEQRISDLESHTPDGTHLAPPPQIAFGEKTKLSSFRQSRLDFLAQAMQFLDVSVFPMKYRGATDLRGFSQLPTGNPMEFKKRDLALYPLLLGACPDLTYGQEMVDIRPLCGAATQLLELGGLAEEFCKITELEWGVKALSEIWAKLKTLVERKTTERIFLPQLKVLKARSGRKIPVRINSFPYIRKNADLTLKRSVFFQLFEQLQSLKTVDHFYQTPFFSVEMTGFAAQDGGGPYRETLSIIAQEIMSTHPSGGFQMNPLFALTPDSKGRLATRRTVMPVCATNPGAQALFRFFGQLLGGFFCSNDVLAVDFPPLFWKLLSGDVVDYKLLTSIDQTLEDKLSNSSLMEYLRHSQSMEEAFPGVSERWQHVCSQHGKRSSSMEGRSDSVGSSDADESCQLLRHVIVQQLLEEYEGTFAIIREGMSTVVPLQLIRGFSWQDVEKYICGQPVVNVDELRKVVQGDLPSPVSRMFWNCVERMTPEDRSLLLRFWTGQSRLPLAEKSCKIQHSSEGTDRLPQSATCFLTLKVPSYSSEERMMDRFLYAIRHCQAIDLDGSARGQMEFHAEELA